MLVGTMTTAISAAALAPEMIAFGEYVETFGDIEFVGFHHRLVFLVGRIWGKDRFHGLVEGSELAGMHWL